ncbi:MAG TPA: alpha/beta hydrolase-fold protein [Candidatus Binatus sp.]|uniref:alpha/beta hydrolase n=1 Tax=Candidatus Binatus sp. TaxID=2811406 RepID=UPI002F3F1239
MSDKSSSRVELADLPADFAPKGVPYAVLVPPGYDDSGAYPLCLLLHGGGGSRENLAALKPLFDNWWTAGIMPPMVIASASTGAMSYYLDHPDGSARWETFVAEDFLADLRGKYNAGQDRASTLIAGISMGGYGALKIAFARPDQFAAVAAIQPLLEPGYRDADIGARNRLHHGVGGLRELLGENRDAALFESNNPAGRARANAELIRESGLAIYLEVGDADFLNAHDGTEFLHRVLWDLDLAHEYRLIRGADHGGPTFVPRIRDAFAWLGSIVTEQRAASAEPTPDERAVNEWLKRGLDGAPPPVDPGSKAFITMLRAQLKPAREEAARTDPTTLRRYGVLPKTD